MIRLRPALWPTLISLPIFVVSLGLGIWQMERRAWKQDILHRIEVNQAAAPITLDEVLRGDPLRHQYGRVKGAGTVLNDKEVYLAGTWGPGMLKYSHTVTILFGAADSKNSWYVDLSATFDIGYWGLSLTPHVGYQKVKNTDSASYTDWSLTVSKEFMPGLTGSLSYVSTDIDVPGPGGRNLGKSGAVVGVKYTF